MALLCLHCGQEALALGVDGPLPCCPNCGSTGVPADTEDRCTIDITWHELRVLVIWAERWASHDVEMLRVLYGITDRIHAQHLDAPPITFLGDLTQLRERYGDVQQNVIRELDT